MTDRWDFYFCTIEDKIASIYLDLGIFDSTPIAELPLAASVRLRVNSPSDNGLPSSAEFDALQAIEEALEDRLGSDRCQYVGRCTTDFHRDFCFYIDRSLNWEQSVVEVMSSFPDYRYTAYTSEDRDWEIYRAFLYPSRAERRQIDNRQMCIILEQNGDRLEEAREIEHWADFSHDRNRSEFVTEAIELGFILGSLDESSTEEKIRYSARIWRLDIPSFQNIDTIVSPLFHLAIAHNGKYDGWSCAVVRSSESKPST
jgi:Family of unknown function (DUF695)/Regulator of ribonuclease activity B